MTGTEIINVTSLVFAIIGFAYVINAIFVGLTTLWYAISELAARKKERQHIKQLALDLSDAVEEMTSIKLDVNKLLKSGKKTKSK